MQSFLVEWIKDILILFVVISLVELIMPKGRMKSYVNFIVGILVIFVIINPFVRIINSGFDTTSILKEIDYNEEENRKALELQEKQIKDIYVENMKAQTAELIESSYDYQVSYTEIDTIPDKQNLFLVDKVTIYIKDKFKPEKDQIKVEKILVGSENIAKEVFYEQEDLYELVQGIFGIDKDKINIFIEREENHGGAGKED